jgi:SAM-dependent methyltransferase
MAAALLGRFTADPVASGLTGADATTTPVPRTDHRSPCSSAQAFGDFEALAAADGTSSIAISTTLRQISPVNSRRPAMRWRGRTISRALPVALVLGLSMPLAAQRPSDNRGALFPPEDLGRLAPPDRDDWQQPERIMDALGIAENDYVADVGAGGGWFTIRLAQRVGPNGRVVAEDIQPPMLASISRAVSRAGLRNVETRLGTPTDPRLSPGLQAVLIVDLYSQPGFRQGDPVAMLQNIAASLAAAGRLGIVDFKNDGAGGPGPALDERVDPDVIVRDAAAAGLKLRSRESFLRYQYLLIFGK